jgi:DNA-3-methyladenine glycosylase I
VLAPVFGRLFDADGVELIPAHTDMSRALSKDRRARGWKFVGPTTMYAFMQAMGLVNDHLAG